MPKRYFEIESDSAEESWRKIRALRSSPPPAMPATRSTLFASSLEQAQQQFDAAAHIGFESRALNLYYGLSQAGRAIAAALTPENIGKSPEISGHGLKVVDFQSIKPDTLWGTQVRAEGSDDTSYGRLASLLRSDPLRSPVSLGAIWHMLPEVCLDYPAGNYVEPRWADRQPRWKNRESVDDKTFTLQATKEEIEDDGLRLRSSYPDLNESKLLKFGGSSHSVLADGTRTDEAKFTYAGQSRLRRLRNDTVLMPATNSGSEALDPLLAWWLLLYTLSMITRYKPAAWTRIMDVNRSPLAVPIETALNKALEAGPSQIYASLTSQHLTAFEG